MPSVVREPKSEEVAARLEAALRHAAAVAGDQARAALRPGVKAVCWSEREYGREHVVMSVEMPMVTVRCVATGSEHSVFWRDLEVLP